MTPSPRQSARRLGLSEMTGIASRWIAASANGDLYEWDGRRWLRLERVHYRAGQRPRLLRYAGHPDSARSVNI